MKKVIRYIAIIFLIGAIIGSGYSALKIQNNYHAEETARIEATPYRPVMPEAVTVSETNEKEPFVNQGILDLQAQYPDAIGWIAIPFTGVDHPFVQAEDNNFYLRRDMDGNHSMAGTLFMDCQNSGDFSDFNTIIYGHHMKNGTMFAPLNRFGEREFFDTNTNGMIFLADKTINMEFFAYMVIQADDLTVYENPLEKTDRNAYLQYIRENARHYRDTGIGAGDRIITLSTCAYEFKDARMLLIGRSFLLH